MKTLALLEDDPILGRSLVITLQAAGYYLHWFKSIREISSDADLSRFDLLVLDVGLPDGNGIDFLQSQRQLGMKVPAVFLTARHNPESVVDGFGAGATDYVRKPFDNSELIARIKSALRDPNVTERKIKLGELVIHVDQRRLKYNENQINLNRRQFDILCYLADRAGTVVSRESLIQSIKQDGDMNDRTIDSHISHLRTVLKKAGVNGVSVVSVYGVGYRIEVVQKVVHENS